VVDDQRNAFREMEELERQDLSPTIGTQIWCKMGVEADMVLHSCGFILHEWKNDCLISGICPTIFALSPSWKVISENGIIEYRGMFTVEIFSYSDRDNIIKSVICIVIE
jgi:hypothetical protein